MYVNVHTYKAIIVAFYAQTEASEKSSRDVSYNKGMHRNDGQELEQIRERRERDRNTQAESCQRKQKTDLILKDFSFEIRRAQGFDVFGIKGASESRASSRQQSSENEDLHDGRDGVCEKRCMPWVGARPLSCSSRLLSSWPSAMKLFLSYLCPFFVVSKGLRCILCCRESESVSAVRISFNTRCARPRACSSL